MPPVVVSEVALNYGWGTLLRPGSCSTAQLMTSGAADIYNNTHELKVAKPYSRLSTVSYDDSKTSQTTSYFLASLVIKIVLFGCILSPSCN